jgi:hypothetical protein
MIRTRMFYGYSTQIAGATQQYMNKWQAKHDDIEILHILQSASGTRADWFVAITLVYKSNKVEADD